MRILPSLVALLFCFPALAVEETITSTLTVHGEAVSKVAPDQVSLPVTVREENISLKTARDKHDERLRMLLQLASDTGIAKEKIRTSYTSVNPMYDYVKDTTHPRLRGYQVQSSIDFTLTDITKLGRFIQHVTDAGIDTLGSVSYSLQNEDKLKEDTLARALENAHAKAEHLAATAKVTLGGPLSIDEGSAQLQRPIRPMHMEMKAMAMDGAAASAPVELPSGEIEIRQSVTVTYTIK